MPKTLTRKLALTAVLALAFSGLTISAAPATNTVEINSRLIMRQTFPPSTAGSSLPITPARTTGS